MFPPSIDDASHIELEEREEGRVKTNGYEYRCNAVGSWQTADAFLIKEGCLSIINLKQENELEAKLRWQFGEGRLSQPVPRRR
jgi:hypothetical protein